MEAVAPAAVEDVDAAEEPHPSRKRASLEDVRAAVVDAAAELQQSRRLVSQEAAPAAVVDAAEVTNLYLPSDLGL